MKTNWNISFENTLKHIIWKPLKPMRKFENTFETLSFENHWNQWGNLKTNWNTSFKNHWNLWGNLKTLETHHLKTIETNKEICKHFETYIWKHIIWKPLKPMVNFENTLKHIIWKPLKPMVKFEKQQNLKTNWNIIIWKHIETHHLKTIETNEEIWKHFETHYFKTIETYEEIWKHFETHDLKTIETYEEIWKHLKHIIWKQLKPIRKFENTLKHIIWKPLKPMTKFENTLKHIIWKHIIWKPLEPMGKFENTLKHIIWKPLKPMGKFENTLKHIIWKHIETLWGNLKTLWNTSFENHWNLWGNLKTLWNIPFQNDWNLWGILKTLWNTSFKNHWNLWGNLKILSKHFIWKPLKTMGSFENTLKHIIWKPWWSTCNVNWLLTDFREETDAPGEAFYGLGTASSCSQYVLLSYIYFASLYCHSECHESDLSNRHVSLNNSFIAKVRLTRWTGLAFQSFRHWDNFIPNAYGYFNVVLIEVIVDSFHQKYQRILTDLYPLHENNVYLGDRYNVELMLYVQKW